MRSIVGLVLAVSPFLSLAQNHDCRAWTGVSYQYCSGQDLELLPDSTYFFCAVSHPGVFGNPGGYRGFVGRLDANLELTQAEAVPIPQPVGYYGLRSLTLRDDGGIIAVGEHLNHGIIQSFSSSLDLQWTRITLDTMNESSFNSVERTLDGNFVAAGLGPWGALVVKFDSLGQLIWSREFQYMYSGTEVSELLEAPNGDLVLIGFCAVGGWTTGSKDVQVHRLDSAGNLLWHTELGTQHSEQAYGGALTAIGDIIVVGNTHEVFFEEQTGKAFVLSLNASGQVNWQKTFDKPNGSQELRDAIVLDDGTIVCAGVTDTLATSYGLIIELDSTGAVTDAMTLKGSGAYEAAILFTLAPRFGGGGG